MSKAGWMAVAQMLGWLAGATVVGGAWILLWTWMLGPLGGFISLFGTFFAYCLWGVYQAGKRGDQW